MKKILILFLLIFVVNAHARTSFLDNFGISQTDEPPLVEEAFQFSTSVVSQNQIVGKWTVLEGNYLYKDKIRYEVLTPNSVSLDEYVLPAGENKMDETFGLTEVYHHDIQTNLKLIGAQPLQEVAIRAYFQGCSETFGICYPPSHTDISLVLPEKTSTVEMRDKVEMAQPLESSSSEQDRIAQKLAEDNLFQIILGFLGLGLLLAFTPCVFPMIPILSSIIVGEGEHITTRRAFILSLTYVLAMSVTYTAAGIMTGLLGENLQALFQNPWVIYSFSALFVILAMSMFGLFELQMPHFMQHHLHQISHKQQGGNLLGVIFMGLLSGLIVGPCLAPPLAGALIFIGQSADPVLGGIALFSLSIGMGIPLLIIGTSAGSVLPNAGDWMNTIKSIFGVLLLGLAIWMLERVLPGWLILVLWGALLIVTAVYMGAVNALQVDANGWDKFLKGLGLLLLIYGSLLVIGGASGSHNLWQPLDVFAQNKVNQVSERKLQFTGVNNLNELHQQIERSQRPVMLDFYADWCTDCKIMERTTFRDPAVLNALAGYTLLKLDMTENTEAHKTILRHYKVFGPPTLLFFNTENKELSPYRLIGHADAEAFVEHLNSLPAL